MTNQFTLWIPTYRRPRVKTWDNLPPKLQSVARIIVDQKDYETLRSTYPEENLHIHPAQGKGGPVIKQALLEQTHTPIGILLDDDLSFQEAYWDSGNKKFKTASPKAVEVAFQECVQMAQEDRVGFSAFGVPFFNKLKDKWAVNKKGVYALFFNMEAVRDSKASYNQLPTMGDVWMLLSLATSGYQSRVHSHLVCVDQSKRGVGGESAIQGRDRRHEEAMNRLVKRWPEYVKFKDASNNKAHQKNIGTKQDITILFSKAVKDHQ